MGYYINIDDGKINGGSELDNSRFATETNFQIEVSKELYEDCMNEPLKYIYSNGSIVPNPNYEADKQAQERAELDALTLTPADVERALYRAKGMDFEDLKTLIAQSLPQVDIKGLAIEFRAKDFYRGATANGIRLFDVVGQLLGYSSNDMDYLFLTKELPNEKNN